MTSATASYHHGDLANTLTATAGDLAEAESGHPPLGQEVGRRRRERVGQVAVVVARCGRCHG
ncbi:MAG: hypothetical protein AAGK32_11900, partial [Actinomycetota bacterium]